MEKLEEEDEDEGGGFLPDQSADEIAQPTAKPEITQLLSSLEDDDDDDGGGGFRGSEDENRESKAPQISPRILKRVHDDDGDNFRLHTDEKRARGEVGKEDHLETRQEEKNSSVHISKEHDGQTILDEGGGFLPDDDVRNDIPGTDDPVKPDNPIMSIPDNYGSIGLHSASQKCEHFEEALPDLPAGELEEAQMLQQLYESQESELSESKVEITVPASSKSPSPPPEQGKKMTSEQGVPVYRVEISPSDGPMTVEDSAPDSSEEDKGSLLSHDPDDEDADPEWLV